MASNHIAIIGSGPTATYTLKHLTEAPGNLNITVFEAGAKAGPGMPYSRRNNSSEMLANIASVEIPKLTQSLVDWLHKRSDRRLARLHVSRDEITDRTFYPRVIIGEYFTDEFAAMCRNAEALGHQITIRLHSKVVDIVPRANHFDVRFEANDKSEILRFDAVVLATGHRQKISLTKQKHLFRSPYPTRQLTLGPERSAGIIGSSLSAIDATIALAHKYGRFEGSGAKLKFIPDQSHRLHVSMMSRKGLLPEADFYYPIPEEPLDIFSDEAVQRLVAKGKTGLLNAAMALFRKQLLKDDPHFATEIGLYRASPERFAKAYFDQRHARHQLKEAADNLAEARRNHRRKFTIMWRYTLMRAHEVFATLVPYLDNRDLARFHKSLKLVFADAYGCVPHLSIARLLAMAEAGSFSLIALGDRGKIIRSNHRFALKGIAQSASFQTLIDARGQSAMSLDELGFATLNKAVRKHDPYRKERRSRAINDFRLALKPRFSPEIFCLSLPLMLKRYPFAQGLVASDHYAQSVAGALHERFDEIREAELTKAA